MSRRAALLAVEILAPVGLLTAWWFLSLDTTSPFFPPLRTMLRTFWETWTWDRIQQDVFPSVVNFSLGYVIAAVVGIAIGVFFGLNRIARRATEPTVDFLRSIPAPAIISVFIIVLGFEDTMKITAIAFASTFPILLNTIDGVRGVDQQQLEMARAYKLRRQDEIFKIILPAASPQIFAGLRISLAVALAVMAFSEMFAGTDGLGFFIIFSQATYRVNEMYAGIFMLGILGYTVNLIFLATERRILRWHRGWRASELGAQGGG
ncbi:MAG TPA: ABC transporter permease [Acidimicrobiia bacterium]|jgi:ABC-type nitrate/sulfonate/bicarbonate transport system permease component